MIFSAKMARYGQECGNGLKIAVASFIKVSLVGNLNFCQEMSDILYAQTEKTRRCTSYLKIKARPNILKVFVRPRD